MSSSSVAPIQPPATPEPRARALRRTHSGLPSAGVSPVSGFWAAAALVRPGRTALWALFGILGLAVLQWVFASTVLSLLTGGMILLASGLAFREYRWVIRQHQGLQVRRALPILVGRGVEFSFAWELENHNDFPLVGQLRDVFPSAAIPRFTLHPFRVEERGGRVELSQLLRIPVRGRHEFGPLWIVLQGPRGWVEVQRPYALTSSIKVLPEQFASRDELLKDRGAEHILRDKTTRTRLHGAGTEFESLIDYREGDDPRRIDWRATARIQRPVVRRFQVERHRDVMILIDCGRLMGTDAGSGTKLDRAVDAGLVLARVVLQSGDRCGMALFDDAVRGYLPPVSGVPSLNILAESIYDARSEFRETDFGPMFARLQARQAKRSLLVVISDISDPETSQLLRASLASLSQRHVVLFAALRTPLLKQVLAAPTTTLVDAAKKVVTLQLMRERHLSLQSLKHAGVFVIDIEPQQLTVPLVNQVITLRERTL